jgi:hypothetical protein
VNDPLATALDSLRSILPGVAVHLRPNRRTLLSLRGRPGNLRLSLHPQVLVEPDHAAAICAWVLRRGRGGAGVHLRSILSRVHERLARHGDPVHRDAAAQMAMVAGPVDLEAMLSRILTQSFPGLPRPDIQWARRSSGRLISLRFGTYRRQPRPGRIALHPRLDRPWIAQLFIEHVVHHELCHHRQACQPLYTRETAHSARFRVWERAYAGYTQARVWERAALPWLLDDQPPPWYGTT